jgi:phage baseplate assembly protein gpV
MVERLMTLLHEEAADLVVPPAPAEAILRRARRDRRRRRVTEAVVGLAAVTIVAAGAGAVIGRGSHESPAQHQFASASAGTAYEDYGAFAVGSTVYIGNHQVRFPEKVKALYYTALGVLVRMGHHAYTDEAGPSHYTLVHPDGTTKDIDLRMGDRVPGTDPESPYVAYAEPAGATSQLSATETRKVREWSLVVVSLETGAEVARTTVSGSFTWGGWEAPPVDLAGSRMWALLDDGWREFDWATGTTRLVPGTANAPMEAAHGRYALYDDGSQIDWLVKDFVTGALVRTVPMDPENNVGNLSPDGRFVRYDGGANAAYDGDTGKLITPPSPSRFFSLETGKTIALPQRVFWGWTPDGAALSVDGAKDEVTVCDASTGSCDRIHLQIGSGKVKLGGLSYES